ncbi:hypothetical protein Tco_0835551 [Tanacetum coccineum]
MVGCDTEVPQLQDDCDVQATNISLHGLSPDVFALVNHQEAAKDIWDRVNLLMKGTKLSYQEHECRLYNLFDKFAYVQGETLYEYYWRFSQLINDMHTIGMTMQQVQVNIKFLNALPPEWSKFVTDVKLAKSSSLYPPPQQFTPVYAAPIHHQHHHTPVNPQQQSVSPQPFTSLPVTLQSQAEFPQLDYVLVVPTFQQGEDLIDCINKAMAFLSLVALRPRSSTLFKEKLMLAKAQEVAFQIEDLDAYDLDYDDISSAKAVLMENLSSCDLDDEVPEFMVKFLKMIQVHLNAIVHNIRTDNGTEFVNQTLKAMACEQLSSGPGPKLLTPGIISSGLVPNITSLTPYVPPTKNDWEILFQPMFDEYLNPSSCVDLQVPIVIAPELAISTGTPSSTTIDQDALSTSTSQTTP